MYVNVVFVIRCLYSAVSLTLVKEQSFIRIISSSSSSNVVTVQSDCKRAGVVF